MKNTVYRLIEPKKIIAVEQEINEQQTEDVIVRPVYLSICHADQRYYQGQRDPEVLKKKLPMALIHEGIGQVIRDNKGEFKEGEWVVMVPNTPFEEDEVIGENYLRSSKFRASGYDGFMQTYVEMRRDRLVRLPEGVDREILAFVEICTVDYHIVDRFDKFADKRRDILGVWGEGNMGYITALFLKTRFPESKVYVFGVVKEKLDEIKFADAVYTVDNIPDDVYVDHAFECVGGNGSPIAIEQIIGLIKPEATISILGVSEYPVPINTRMILEKGLRVFGSSRSGVEDFQRTVDMYVKHPEIIDYLGNLVSSVNVVRRTADIKEAFEKDTKKAFGKTIMKWEE